ncbi:MAG: ribosome small subunit-dependent GTPase A [Candidatus Thioglobus sp.]|nr:ribosome small subunit-dependent GTPase A [Candidatus Thioglobus sp.]
MSLTRRQKWRIEKIQNERIFRAEKAANKVENQAKNNTKNSSKEQVGLVITRFGQHLLVESKSGDLLSCTGRQNIELSVAGDRVLFQPLNAGEGVVTALLERDNQLRRGQKLIAANIDQLFLIVALQPHYQFELIDRYLIIAQNANLPISILVNKIELAKNIQAVKADFAMYQAAGYTVDYLSVKEKINIDEFKANLKNKTQLFLGQSGVGKSSLINALIPQLNLRINEISKKTKLGKHTTTNTTLYRIASGGNLVDSPGVMEFQLDDLSAGEILNGFREFKPFFGNCKFRNCTHINEPNCAVKTAVKSGKIHPKRYQNYLNLIS